MNYIQLVFNRLQTITMPTQAQREVIYQACRDEVAAKYTDTKVQAKALEELEKAIRRQEMQACYEETLRPR